MNIEKIKEIVTYLKNQSYQDVISSLIVYDNLDYLHDLEELNIY